MSSHDHVAYVASIRKKYALKQQRSQRRKAIGQKLMKVFGKGQEKSAPAKPTAPSKSNYIKQKRGGKEADIGQLSPRVTPSNAYVQAKRAASRNYQYTSQRQKIKAPFKTR